MNNNQVAGQTAHSIQTFAEELCSFEDVLYGWKRSATTTEKLDALIKNVIQSSLSKFSSSILMSASSTNWSSSSSLHDTAPS